jgi:lysophospholipase L1-like esterase
MRLTMADHPYLPYYGTSGLYGQVILNSLGDRGPDPDEPKRRIRIVSFGGSTTFGQDEPWELTWPGQLQDLLGSSQFEVLSAAHNGDTTADSLVKLALIYVDLKPDIVLVYHGTNDLEASYSRNFRADYAHRRRDVGATPYPVFDRLPRWLDYSSYFVTIRSNLVGYRGSMWRLYTRPEVGLDLENGPFGLPTFQRNLQAINALAQLAGARLVLGTFQYYRPWAEEYHGSKWAEAWQRGLGIQNEIIRELAAREENIYVADVARAFHPTGDHMTDFCHLTALGNEEIARAFAHAIREMPALPSNPGPRLAAERSAPAAP